ncbi:MFS transporter [Novosphingobium cyanobacteriorum]|uniref:Multidrug efflux pump Tap n=1 Tax=Novosphingobium cyanobacteriorum TaxID=3024215 RepID=A0ABT6CQI4_9SPHN|nr:MFS transporter [Novosphingobium cyanobacteriorum]MDF8335415.1 MFS transporter [Novosphingobium cyanobacteriorum]
MTSSPANFTAQPTSPLQIADYRRFLVARFASVFATNGMVIVLGYQLYDHARTHYGMSISEAAFQLGLLGLAQFLPLFLLTPVAGVVADRFDRRLVTGLALLLDLSIALTLAIMTQAGISSLPVLFLLGALHGTARVFIGPASSSIAPNVVPAALMPRAVAVNSIAWQIGSVAGPSLAGVLFAVERSLPYWVSVVFLAVAALNALRIRPLPPPPGNRDIHPLRQISDGLSFVWNDRFLLGCVTLDLFAVLLGGATALLPVYARDILTWNGHPVGSYGLGVMRAMPGLGAALVALVLARKPITDDVGVKMLLAVALFGAATIGFGLSRSFPLSLLMLATLGGGDMISVFIRNTLVQLHTPDAVRGRVSSISGLAISASNELGEMQSGVTAALLGATGAVVFGGVGAIVVTALWAVWFPELRRVKTFAAKYN